MRLFSFLRVGWVLVILFSSIFITAGCSNKSNNKEKTVQQQDKDKNTVQDNDDNTVSIKLKDDNELIEPSFRTHFTNLFFSHQFIFT